MTVASVGWEPTIAWSQESSVAFRNQQSLWKDMAASSTMQSSKTREDAPEPADLGATSAESASLTVKGVTSTGKVAPAPSDRLTVTTSDNDNSLPALPIVPVAGGYQPLPAQPRYTQEVGDYGSAVSVAPHTGQPLPRPVAPQAYASSQNSTPVTSTTTRVGQAPLPNSYRSSPNAATRIPATSQTGGTRADSNFNFFNVVTRTPAVSGQQPLKSGYAPYSNEAARSPYFDRVSYALQDGEAPPVQPTPPAAAGGQQGGSSLSGENTRLGTEPQSNELVFLRRQTVLLAAGQAQFDVGFSYSHLDDDRPLPLIDGGGDVVGVVEARTRQRLLVAPFEIRYGLTDRIQLFANTAVGWASSEIAVNGFSETEDVGGISDTRFGASMLLRAGQCDSPDIVFTLGGTAPTGNDTFITNNLVPNSQLGEGFWSVFANLLFVHTWDPMVVFYGVGYNHRFDADFVGLNVDPGEEFNYQLGVGFAVNSNVSLSAQFLGAYISEARINGDVIEGSALEPMRTRFAVTVARNGRIWEPFAELPMTEDAAARVGMTWTY